jgi:sulfhydrogenase subunit delta
MIKNNRPKIAIISLTSCSGCQVEALNLGEKFLDILEYVKIGNFPLIEERRDIKKYDIAFIEGVPISKKNVRDLKKVRKKSKILVALGTCACLGGVPEIKDYQDKEKVIRSVYLSIKKIDNPKIKSLKEYIKVDFELPGCPINKSEFYQVVCDLLANKTPRISQRPVCYECGLKEYDCLLQKGLLCLGPITLGGCEAVCLGSGIPCDSCRGLLEKPKIVNLLKILKKQGIGAKEFLERMERFGVKDEMLEKIK